MVQYTIRASKRSRRRSPRLQEGHASRSIVARQRESHRGLTACDCALLLSSHDEDYFYAAYVQQTEERRRWRKDEKAALTNECHVADTSYNVRTVQKTRMTCLIRSTIQYMMIQERSRKYQRKNYWLETNGTRF